MVYSPKTYKRVLPKMRSYKRFLEEERKKRKLNKNESDLLSNFNDLEKCIAELGPAELAKSGKILTKEQKEILDAYENQ